MTGPRIPFRQLLGGASVITTQDLIDSGVSLFVPAEEPLNAGPLPVRPSFVSSVQRPFSVRAMRCGTGHLVTSPLQTKVRCIFTLQWAGITRDERDQLLEFFWSELEGTKNGFSLEVDGPAVPASSAVLRFLTDPVPTWSGKAVHMLPPLQAEELFR